MMNYCPLEPWEQTSVIVLHEKYNQFHVRKCIRKCRLRNVVYVVQAFMCQSVCKGKNKVIFPYFITKYRVYVIK